MKYAPLLTGLMFITCCASTPKAPEPVIITKEVLVPVPISCDAEIPETPDYPDTDALLLATETPEERLKRVVAGRTLRITHEAQLTRTLATCKGIHPNEELLF